MSITIPLTKEQLDHLILNISKINLEWIKDIRETYPLDFTLLYNQKYIVHFEYLSENLEFFTIGIIEM